MALKPFLLCSKRASKNPKENKKPDDFSMSKLPSSINTIGHKSISMITTNNNNVLPTSVPKSTTQSSLTKESKSILSANNSTTMPPTTITSKQIPTTTKDSNIKSTLSVVSTAPAASPISLTKVDCLQIKSSSAVDITSSEQQMINVTSPTPSFGNSLTITPIGANDVTSKPLPSVQNKVIL